MKKEKLAALGMLLFAACAQPAAAADDGTLRIGSGLDYSSGKYGGSEKTTILAIPVSARYDRDRWTLKASIPWLEIKGSGRVIPDIGAVDPNATTTAPGTRSSGWGDLVTSVVYNAYYDPASKLGLDVTAKVKWAVADVNKGLSTGENDYTALVDLYKTIDRLTLFGGVGYANLGSSDTFQLRNVWSLNLGGSYKLDDRDSAGLSFDARQRVAATAFPQRELTAFWLHKFEKNWRTQLYLLKGLANGSPDWGGGLSVGYSF
jgi:hypothetical protein